MQQERNLNIIDEQIEDVLTKMLGNQIQQHIKKSVHQGDVWMIQNM